MGLKLSKKLINGERLVITPNWVSNGHWAVRRGLLENGYVLADPEKALGASFEEKEDSLMEGLLPSVDTLLRPARRTPWVYTRSVSWKKKPMECCLFQLEDSNVGLFYNRLYVESLGLDVLWVPVGRLPSFNAERREDVSVLLMPFQWDDVDDVLGHPVKTITSLDDSEVQNGEVE